MQIVVGHDPDARTPGSEGDEPHPVATSHQMVRTEPALTARDSPAPIRIVAPVIDLDTLGHPEPTRIGPVSGRSSQPELTAYQPGATARVHYPSSPYFSCLPVGSLDADSVVQRIQYEWSLHRAAVEDFDVRRPQLGEQQVLEPPAVELEGRYGRKA